MNGKAAKRIRRAALILEGKNGVSMDKQLKRQYKERPYHTRAELKGEHKNESHSTLLKRSHYWEKMYARNS